MLSVGFAGLAGICLVLGARAVLPWHIALLVIAAGLIELRLLCNLMDGMMAVEGGLGTKAGPILNELPDRFSDGMFLVCAGYAVTGPAWGADLGWAAVLLAVLTAYVRALAGSLGATQDFGGPMAKQQRMQVLAAMGDSYSLILFPGCTRGSGGVVGPFRSGLYNLALQRPEVELAPVYLGNLSRVLPKGEFLPVPLASSVTFGPPMHVLEGEEREAFLERARAAVLELKPS